MAGKKEKQAYCPPTAKNVAVHHVDRVVEVLFCATRHVEVAGEK
jgi:hypothetical protein